MQVNTFVPSRSPRRAEWFSDRILRAHNSFSFDHLETNSLPNIICYCCQDHNISTKLSMQYSQHIKHRKCLFSEVAMKTEKAWFGMSWFWFPEAQFGCASGVVATRVGFTGRTWQSSILEYTTDVQKPSPCVPQTNLILPIMTVCSPMLQIKFCTFLVG